MNAPVFGIRTFGNAPVPYTVSWSGEEAQGQFIGLCPHAQHQALCMHTAIGAGKPLFGKPHANRQRETIALGCCDLCGRPLRNRTKVSLSHARVNTTGADGPCIMQVEPMVHPECAVLCIKFCPSLKRDVQAGSLMIRQVTRWRAQFAIMGPQFISHYVPDYVERPGDKIVGHGKVELLSWRDRDEVWLEKAS
jgi:hypothetical protein